MENKILVRVENIYGNRVIYPVCEKALTFARIAGTKTLTRTVIADIKALGYSVEVEQQKVSV